MGLFGRSTADTRSADEDRAAGTMLLDGAKQARARIVAPSRLADAVVTAATSAVGVEAGSPLHGGLVEAVLVGYACRTQRGHGRIPADVRSAIEAHLVRDVDGRVDHERVVDIPDVVHALSATGSSLAASGPTGAAAAGVSEAAWEACCAAGAEDLRAD